MQSPSKHTTQAMSRVFSAEQFINDDSSWCCTFILLFLLQLIVSYIEAHDTCTYISAHRSNTAMYTHNHVRAKLDTTQSNWSKSAYTADVVRTWLHCRLTFTSSALGALRWQSTRAAMMTMKTFRHTVHNTISDAIERLSSEHKQSHFSE